MVGSPQLSLEKSQDSADNDALSELRKENQSISVIEFMKDLHLKIVSSQKAWQDDDSIGTERDLRYGIGVTNYL